MNDFGTVTESLRRSTVHVYSPGDRGGGSGVAWGPDAILTNAHVVGRSRMKVELWDGRTLDATLVQQDRQRDLAMLRVPSHGLAPVRVVDSDSARPGQIVFAIGNPLGFLGALSTGVIHGVGALHGLGPRKWVQADVRLAPGNSGGPLADAEGRLIGINTMIAGGLALAIPSNTAAAFAAEAKPRALLGVTLRPISRLGMLVLEVEPESPADQASLLPGDVLIGANGRAFHSPADLYRAIDTFSQLKLKFLRGNNVVREVVVRVRIPEAA